MDGKQVKIESTMQHGTDPERSKNISGTTEYTQRHLLDVDTFSKSDPVVVLFIQGIGSKEWREYGRTEVIENTLNPDFVRKFVLDYFFEEKQNLRFDVYNVDSRSTNISKHVSLEINF
ncbi:hypothetical protein scyTo_0012881 [Scyliorhinus torazame]|uniref:C2 domain-containing protein n=1 Tax=Scyliorhinus torazame TaxID=75743 RepID=A0A401NK83_SCYTO|nr:hypothetical protein [Scyliorhinus torazame]